jgi:hypothetical protein
VVKTLAVAESNVYVRIKFPPVVVTQTNLPSVILHVPPNVSVPIVVLHVLSDLNASVPVELEGLAYANVFPDTWLAVNAVPVVGSVLSLPPPQPVTNNTVKPKTTKIMRCNRFILFIKNSPFLQFFKLIS